MKSSLLFEKICLKKEGKKEKNFGFFHRLFISPTSLTNENKNKTLFWFGLAWLGLT
jgi:hypothetical protein